MHKYNTLYTRKLSWHVLTPTSLFTVLFAFGMCHLPPQSPYLLIASVLIVSIFPAYSPFP